jgi:hypothetical protein
MATVSKYDETEVLREYLERYWWWYMTEFDRQCHYLGARRAKAQASGLTGFAERVQAEWDAQATPAVRAALADGYEAWVARVKQRIVQALRDGTLMINRCPSCQRVVRTPRARQCTWCGKDWHGSADDTGSTARP